VLEDRGRVLVVAVVCEPRLEGVPVGVAACGGGLADAGRAVADADVAVTAAGVGELGEAAVFLGDQEVARPLIVGRRVDEIVERVQHGGHSSR
jgi:hypothetical protein